MSKYFVSATVQTEVEAVVTAETIDEAQELFEERVCLEAKEVSVINDRGNEEKILEEIKYSVISETAAIHGAYEIKETDGDVE